MNEQLLKTSGTDVLSSRRNSEKPYGGGGVPFLHIRGLSKFNMKTYLNINVFQGFSQEEI